MEAWGELVSGKCQCPYSTFIDHYKKTYLGSVRDVKDRKENRAQKGHVVVIDVVMAVGGDAEDKWG